MPYCDIKRWIDVSEILEEGITLMTYFLRFVRRLINENHLSTGIQMRQLRKDIKHMRSSDGYDAPIVSEIGDGRKEYYFYSDPSFSIK